MFFDEAKVYVKGGDGGNGLVAFRREKYVPRGGPSGGKGGKGGDVIREVDPQLNTLINFKNRSHFRAEGGEHGGPKEMGGKGGGDRVGAGPPGAVVGGAGPGGGVGDLAGPGQ